MPTSSELPGAVSLIVLTAMCYFMGPRVVRWAMQNMREGFSCDVTPCAEPGLLFAYMSERLIGAVMVGAPFLLALGIAGIMTQAAMHEFHLGGKFKLRFDLLNPSAVLKQFFSLQALVKLLLSIVKLSFVGTIVYLYVRSRINAFAALQWAWSLQLLSGIAKLILGVLIRLCVGLLIIGLADYVFQRWRHTEGLKMSKQEIKDERRSTEGPPEAQRAIRRKQFEAAMRRMLQQVPKANVVLVNPTHVAVALQYDPNTMHAPIVVAKGADHLCEKIKEVARAYGVPIIRRPALARELYATVDLDRPVPEKLFIAVAEVLALIHRLRTQRR